jgi:ribosomal protein L11 methyltransferase
MDYLELSIEVEEAYSEILIAELGQIGFDSFVEEEQFLLAYIPATLYQAQDLEDLKEQYQDLFQFSFTQKNIPAQNWNAVWESDYKPVIVRDQCLVRSTFHQIDKKYPYEITINPKMSFGTGHHETTSLMLEFLLDVEVKGKNVIDAGCGTGILAIMAEKRGAAYVNAFDIEEWAVWNGEENIALNNCKCIEIAQMTIQELPKDKTYGLILANINKNTLLKEISEYVEYLETEGELLLSGFYETDLDDIKEVTESSSLTFVNYKTQNNWVAAKFKKE